MVIEIDLQKCEYDFLLMLLSNRQSLSTEIKADILAELARRNRSASTPVIEPH